MNNMFIFTDTNKCIGCLNCELACAATYHHLSFEEIYEAKITLNTRNKVIKVGSRSAPLQCMQCMSPSCMNVCPHDVIQYEQHLIKLNEDKCVGCGCCSLVCPYGSIQMVSVQGKVKKDNRQIASKCNLCYDVQGGPVCITHCPTDAICIIDYQQYSTIISKREQIV